MASFRDDPRYEERLRAIPVTSTGRTAEPDPAITVGPQVIEEYVRWRALGKSYRDAADKVGIVDYEEAKLIERTIDFQDQLQAVRDEITRDPGAAFRDLVPQAIGILMEEMSKGNVAAAREVIKTAASLGKPASEEQEPKSETRRPKETIDDRQLIEDTARRIVETRRPADA